MHVVPPSPKRHSDCIKKDERYRTKALYRVDVSRCKQASTVYVERLYDYTRETGGSDNRRYSPLSKALGVSAEYYNFTGADSS